MVRFKHIGGGCSFEETKEPCDDVYEYRDKDKRIRITILSDRDTHFSMPKEIDIDLKKRVTRDNS